eukprot:TRINITY_DN14748_c0_g1_i1.p1 TRINITY_DN14748_c0_g1~~TRINITY_DN14748_c0_g1_i1.p1  ORF type:complete len:576 (+),score=138.02 TRINITY_DN14748_c0_g1_i1:274-2001(+)
MPKKVVQLHQQRRKQITELLALCGVKFLVYLVKSVTFIAHVSQIFLLISVVTLAQQQSTFRTSDVNFANFLASIDSININTVNFFINSEANQSSIAVATTKSTTSSSSLSSSSGDVATTTTTTTTMSLFDSMSMFPSTDWLVWLVQTHPIAFALAECYLLCEVAFYYFYLSSCRKLQRAAAGTTTNNNFPTASLSSKERLDLAKRCFDYFPADKIPKIFSKWFFGAELDDVLKKGNLERWLAWAFFNKDVEEFNQEELDDLRVIIEHFEIKSGKKVIDAPADSRVKSIRLNLDPLQSASRPMIYYIVIYIMQLMTNTALYAMGFRRYQAGRLVYWLRQVQPEVRLLHSCPSPLFFIHGIGCGLGPYLGLIYSMANEIGLRDVFLIELPHISMRIVENVPDMDEVLKSFDEIMSQHNIDKASFVGHSFGTAVVAWMVKHRANCLRDVVYIDPICFLLCVPKVAYRVVYKKPETAMELLRDYFVTKELYIANSLSKRFVWFHNVLWADQLTRGRTTVILSSNDDIVPSSKVQQYLISSAVQNQKKVDVIWLPETTHAGCLFSEVSKRKVVCAINMCE